MRFLAAALLLSIGSGTAAAMDCADQTQFGLDKCAHAAFERADHALNDSYRQILRLIGADDHTKLLLVATQKAWIAFRDAECKFAVSSTEKAPSTRWNIRSAWKTRR